LGRAGSCRDSILIPIKVRPLPTVKIIDKNISPFCEGESASFSVSGANQYLISPLYNYTKLANNIFKVSPRVSVQYIISGFDQFGCEGKDTVNIDVKPSPFVVIRPSDTVIARGQQLNIMAQGGTSYNWSPKTDILGSSQESEIAIKPDSDIVYTVDVTAANGCKTKGIAIIYVKQDPNPSSSIMSNNLGQVLIYPNPAHEYLTIETNEQVRLTLFNSLGSQVLERDIKFNKIDISISHLANGLYTALLETKTGLRKISKIEILK
ncbi:MAG: T9SS type A sorting domain-containing protein, partial [Chitinophagales bacterium]